VSTVLKSKSEACDSVLEVQPSRKKVISFSCFLLHAKDHESVRCMEERACVVASRNVVAETAKTTKAREALLLGRLDGKAICDRES